MIHFHDKNVAPSNFLSDTDSLTQTFLSLSEHFNGSLSYLLYVTAAVSSISVTTKSSAVAERPPNTSCHWIFC